MVEYNFQMANNLGLSQLEQLRQCCVILG